mmetsp:Transcript_9364/g.28214  ORF Transcript_9364/g.28214 Transcript_9364/m.28214 type:complete len:89 (-) Transcript_9364:2318-2584(-)
MVRRNGQIVKLKRLPRQTVWRQTHHPPNLVVLLEDSSVSQAHLEKIPFRDGLQHPVATRWQEASHCGTLSPQGKAAEERMPALLMKAK